MDRYLINGKDFISELINNDMDLEEESSESEFYYNKYFFKLDNIINIIQNNNILKKILYVQHVVI